MNFRPNRKLPMRSRKCACRINLSRRSTDRGRLGISHNVMTNFRFFRHVEKDKLGIPCPKSPFHPLLNGQLYRVCGVPADLYQHIEIPRGDTLRDEHIKLVKSQISWREARITATNAASLFTARPSTPSKSMRILRKSPPGATTQSYSIPSSD